MQSVVGLMNRSQRLRLPAELTRSTPPVRPVAPGGRPAVANAVHSCVIRWDPEFRVAAWGSDAQSLFGYCEPDVLGTNALATLAPDVPVDARDLRHRMLSTRCGVTQTMRVRDRAGKPMICEWFHAPVLDPGGTLVEFCSVAIDAAHDDAVKNDRLVPFCDALTGLASPAVFVDRVERAIALAARTEMDLAVFFVDLDSFAAIEAAHGNRTADALLSVVASRLRRALRRADSVARLAGDTFLVLLAPAGRSGASTVAARIVECFAEPFLVDARRIVALGSRSSPTMRATPTRSFAALKTRRTGRKS